MKPGQRIKADNQTLQRAYRGSVQNFDRHLCAFLDETEQQLDSPLVFPTSDHGLFVGDDREYFKDTSVDKNSSTFH